MIEIRKYWGEREVLLFLKRVDDNKNYF